MNTREILDSEIIQNDNELILNSVKWWETKRLIFNLIIVGLELSLLLFFIGETKRFGVWNSIVWSILYTIAANIFYSIGWGIEILIIYYFQKRGILKNYRILFLILGVLFSVVLTIILYLDALFYYQYY